MHAFSIVEINHFWSASHGLCLKLGFDETSLIDLFDLHDNYFLRRAHCPVLYLVHLPRLSFSPLLHGSLPPSIHYQGGKSSKRANGTDTDGVDLSL